MKATLTNQIQSSQHSSELPIEAALISLAGKIIPLCYYMTFIFMKRTFNYVNSSIVKEYHKEHLP